MFTIETVTEHDLDELLPLMRAYCDFYEVSPSDAALLRLSRTLITDPDGEGIQLIARVAGTGAAAGFATVYWSWNTLSAARAAIMHDLFVAPEQRGTGLADALIDACADHCRSRGITSLGWQTALDNERAQAVYERVGATSSRWLDYTLDLGE